MMRCFALLVVAVRPCTGFGLVGPTVSRRSDGVGFARGSLSAQRTSGDGDGGDGDRDSAVAEPCGTRRAAVLSALAVVGVVRPSASVAVERAVGSAELECRAAGNCLEVGDWDGAVGWSWGARDRCDATDPRCGADGTLRDAPSAAGPVPVPPPGVRATHRATIDLSVGRSERARLVVGLYDADADADADASSPTRALLSFLDPTQGLVATSNDDDGGRGYGASSTAPVTLAYGGALDDVVPNVRLSFGVASQKSAYARRTGITRVGDDFVPQPRPNAAAAAALPSSVARPLVAGLVSVPAKGVGYGNGGSGPDDEAYADAFQIAATNNNNNKNKENRRVVGQLMDEESMAALARLSSLPTKKGLKGVIPGQNSGPPLLKVQVLSVSVEPISPPPTEAASTTDASSS